MAPAQSKRPDTERKIKSLLSFGATLRKTLDREDIGPSLAADLTRYISAVPISKSAAATAAFEELDSCGTALWNAALKIKSQVSTPDNQNILDLVRVFAFLLLDCGQQSARGTLHNAMRVFKIALKSAKHCIVQKQNELALLVLERAAVYQDALENASAQLPPQDCLTQARLSTDYFVLRTVQSFREGRLDVAEHMFSKTCLSRASQVDPVAAERFTDLLHEIGHDLLEKKHYKDAAKWLKRAYHILINQDVEKLGYDTEDLKLSVTSSLVKALLGLQEEDARAKASDLIDLLQTEVGDKLVVLLLRLELFPVDQEFDPTEYHDCLRRIISTVHLTDSNTKLILHHVYKLKSRNSALACTTLDQLCVRLLDIEKETWVEKVFIARIWTSTAFPNSADAVRSLGEFLELITFNRAKTLTLTASATHAAHILLWKQIEVTFSHQQYDVATSWCQLALHSIFGSSGWLNIAKIERKLLLCALRRHDLSSAREIYSHMSDASKGAPMTKYLMYKLALRSEDEGLATDCLDEVCNESSKDATILYACVLEAQHAGNKRQAATALQRVSENCTARLFISEVEDGTCDADAICKLFEGAAVKAKKSRQSKDSQLFSTMELDWFSRNSYNLALKSSATWDPRQTLCLLQASMKFIELYPEDMDTSALADLSLRRMFCDFMAGSLLIVLARAEDRVVEHLQYYLNIRSHVKSFRERLQDQLGRLEGGAKEDLLRKFGTLLSFEFEAAVRLKAWDDLVQIIDVNILPLLLHRLKAYRVLTQDCAICADPNVYATIADITLCSEAPTPTMLSNLQKIVNVTWKLEGNRIAKLSRWIRCLFQIALNSDVYVADHLLDQIANIVKHAKRDDPYPREELEWLATTTFNRAVDYYCASDDGACTRWAEKALSIAALNGDEDVLHSTLQSKFASLNWGD